MPIYTIETPSGRRYRIEAASEQDAIRGAQTEERRSSQSADISVGRGSGGRVSGSGGAAARVERRPQRRPGAAEDAARSGWAGLVQGGVATGNAMRDMQNLGMRLGGRAASALASAAGQRELGERASAGVDALADTAAPTTGRLVQDAHIGADYQPQTGIGQAARTAGLFAPNALFPASAFGRAASVAIPTVAAEGAAGATAAMGGTPEQQNLARIGGGLGGALASGRVGQRPVTVTRPNALAGEVAAFERAGVDPALVTAQGGRGASQVTNAIAENPVAGILVRGRLRRNVQQAAERAQDIAGRYGTARGEQTTGEAVGAGAQRFSRNRDARPSGATPRAQSTSFAAESDRVYRDAFAPIDAAEAAAVNRAETAVAEAQARHAAQVEAARAAQPNYGMPNPPPDIPSPPSVPAPVVRPAQTTAVLQNLAARANAPNLSQIITDARYARIANALETDAPSLRFRDLRELRTWVRNAQRDPELRQGIPQADLQRLESALTEDIYSNARSLVGEGALRNLQRADQYYRVGSQRINGALEAFAPGQAGEGAYGRIIRYAGSNSAADAQSLLSLKRSLSPAEWGDVAAQVVTNLGRPTPGAANEAGFSLSTFLTNYNRLSPRGRNILFGSVGGGGAERSALQAELDNLAHVIGRLRTVERGANASNSAVAGQSVFTLGGLATNAPVTAKVLGAGVLTGEMMTNPRFVRWLAQIPVAERSPRTWGTHVQQLTSLARDYPQLQQLSDALAPSVPVRQQQSAP